MGKEEMLAGVDDWEQRRTSDDVGNGVVFV